MAAFADRTVLDVLERGLSNPARMCGGDESAGPVQNIPFGLAECSGMI